MSGEDVAVFGGGGVHVDALLVGSTDNPAICHHHGVDTSTWVVTSQEVINRRGVSLPSLTSRIAELESEARVGTHLVYRLRDPTRKCLHAIS